MTSVIDLLAGVSPDLRDTSPDPGRILRLLGEGAHWVLDRGLV